MGIIRALAPVAALCAAVYQVLPRLVMMLVAYVFWGWAGGWQVGTGSILEVVAPPIALFILRFLIHSDTLFSSPGYWGLSVLGGGYTTLFVVAAVLPALAKLGPMTEFSAVPHKVGLASAKESGTGQNVLAKAIVEMPMPNDDYQGKGGLCCNFWPLIWEQKAGEPY